MSSINLLVMSLGFSMYSIMSSASSDSFTSSFLLESCDFFSPCLIVVARNKKREKNPKKVCIIGLLILKLDVK